MTDWTAIEQAKREKGERLKGRGDELREEIRRLNEQGRCVEAEQARRTLAEGIATGVCR